MGEDEFVLFRTKVRYSNYYYIVVAGRTRTKKDKKETLGPSISNTNPISIDEEKIKKAALILA